MRNIRSGVRAGIVTLGLLGSGCESKVAPDPPSIAEMEEPVVEASQVQIAFTMPLETIRETADLAIPAEFSISPFDYRGDGGIDPPACGWNAGYRMERAPLTMFGDGKGISTVLDLQYWLKIRKRVPCPGPLLNATCGYGRSGPNTASVTINTSLTIQPDWHAVVNSTVGEIRSPSPCQVRFLDFDVTSKVVDILDPAIETLITQLNENTKRILSLREPVERVWSQLQAPIALTDDAWLTLDPRRVAIEPLSTSHDEIRTSVRFVAYPHIVVGARPAERFVPLPDAETSPPGNAFHVILPVQIEHQVLRTQLREVLQLDHGGISFPATGRLQIRITDADVYGYGEQAVVWVTFEGAAKGKLYLKGTPTFDPETQNLSFPDLDYDVETKNLVLRLMEWFKHDQLRDFLRTKAKFDLSPHLNGARQRITDALNQKVGDLELQGAIDELVLSRFHGNPDASRFVVYFRASGRLNVRLRPSAG